MAPKGRSTAAGSGADTRTYRAAYGQPKMSISRTGAGNLKLEVENFENIENDP